jgi:preprotein translocase subunit SecG
MVDNWTIVNAALFIAEIIAITLLFKHKKDTIEQEKTKP